MEKVKREYTVPELAIILLDTGISLNMESDPPTFESKNSTENPGLHTFDPYKGA